MEEDEVVRLLLALIIVLSTLSVFTVNGCSNPDIPAEEGKQLTQNNTPVTGSNMTGQYQTATFALG